jgi:uncharacterized protein involved in exopolysaccharide biosynthesis
MKRAIRVAAWFYPKRWRERYGDEFEALLDDARADWRSFGDVLKGAAKMQLSHWGFGRITLVSAVAGALIAAGVSFSLPDRWESQAVIKITPAQISEDTSRIAFNQSTYGRIQSIQQTIESRTVLSTIINNFGLYPRERSREPIEDVIEEMRSNIKIVPIASNDQAGRRTIPAFGVSFSYEDRHKAQQVSREIVQRFMDESFREPVVAHGVGEQLEILDPPTFPQRPVGPNRLALTGGGLLAGLTGGIVIVVAIRVRRKSTGNSPPVGVHTHRRYR